MFDKFRCINHIRVRRIQSQNGKFMPNRGKLTGVKLLYFPVQGNADAERDLPGYYCYFLLISDGSLPKKARNILVKYPGSS